MRDFTINYDSIQNGVQKQFNRVYDLSLVAMLSANLFASNNIDAQTLYNIASNIKRVSNLANETISDVNQSVYALRDVYIILFALPTMILILIFLSMLFRFFVLIRILMVITFIFVFFFFGFFCLTSSVTYSFSKHICDSAINLIDLSTQLPADCVDNYNTFDYLNQCLHSNSTSKSLLDDIGVQDFYLQVQSLLAQNTWKLLQVLRINDCPSYNISVYQIDTLYWENSAQIASSEETIQMLRDNLKSVSNVCPTSIVISMCSSLSQELMSFGALLDLVDCGPLSAFYETTAENTFCTDLNNNLLFVSICIAGVIILMIPILMITFKFGYRPWSQSAREPKLLSDSPSRPQSYQSVPTVQFEVNAPQSVPQVQFEINVPPIEVEPLYPSLYPSMNPDYQEV